MQAASRESSPKKDFSPKRASHPPPLRSSSKASGLWVGLLDIFGFERFEKDSFEQLCINLSNERLESHYAEVIFRRDLDEYKAALFPTRLPLGPSLLLSPLPAVSPRRALHLSGVCGGFMALEGILGFGTCCGSGR